MKKAVYIFFAIIGLCGSVKAQDTMDSGSSSMPTDMFFLGYEVAIPTSTDYLSEVSWAGFRVDYRHMISSNVSIGIAMSFNTFDEYFDKQTYQRPDGTGAVTSDMIRQVYTTPITASVHYYLDGNMIRPYFGVGVGAQYSEQNAYFNIYSIETNNWGFVVRPEVGFLAKLNDSFSGFLSASFNYATNKNDEFKIDNISQVPITIGLVFTP